MSTLVVARSGKAGPVHFASVVRVNLSAVTDSAVHPDGPGQTLLVLGHHADESRATEVYRAPVWMGAAGVGVGHLLSAPETQDQIPRRASELVGRPPYPN